MMKKVLFTLFLIISLFFVLSSEGLAQTITGLIKGKIVDEDGSPLPGVTVSIASPAMQGKKTFITSADGNYRFPLCPPDLCHFV